MGTKNKESRKACTGTKKTELKFDIPVIFSVHLLNHSYSLHIKVTVFSSIIDV